MSASHTGLDERDRTMVRPDSQRIPARTVAAVALMETGVTDYAVIAKALGLSESEVAEIDAAEDAGLRQLAVAGVPEGFYYTLRVIIRCPRCGRRIRVAPCLTCKSRKTWKGV
jgi:hypothetical protein